MAYLITISTEFVILENDNREKTVHTLISFLKKVIYVKPTPVKVRRVDIMFCMN